MVYEQKIIGINTSFERLFFKGFEEYDFSSTVSCLDYDAAVIYADNIPYAYDGNSTDYYGNKQLLSEHSSHQIVEDFELLKKQLIEMLNAGKNIYILMGSNDSFYIYTGRKEYSGTGKNTRTTNIVASFDTYSFLPVVIEPTHITGEKIENCCNPPFSDFFRNVKSSSYYSSFFELPGATSLAKIHGTEKVVSAIFEYEKGHIIFLPNIYGEEYYEKIEDWKKDSNRYLSALFELNNSLSIRKDEYVLPEWTSNFSILNELNIQKKLDNDRLKLIKLKEQIEREEKDLSYLEKYKLLLTASGTILEDMVKEVMTELGFTLFEAEKGRSDVIAQYMGIDIVAEIKGVSKSAAEKHGAQLEKWVAQFMEENEKHPKALLIVNGFCDTPISERHEEVFPEQMLKYSNARGHILITTTQLLCLYIESRQNPTCKQERITEMLSSTGKYEYYKSIDDYLILNVDSK